MNAIRLSPSKLNLFNECPRCFHDAYSDSKCPRPRGIFPSLPGGMDLIMKKYVDNFRGDLPPSLKRNLPGVLFGDLNKMNKWRHWRTGLTYIDSENNITLIGALDDCLVDGDVYMPLDWKTKGSRPKDDGSQYYQTQLDCYNLMLAAQGLKVRNEGWLVYIYPEPVKSMDAETELIIDIPFAMLPFNIACDKERAKEIVIKAAECLRGVRPESSARCEHCMYLENLKQIA